MARKSLLNEGIEILEKASLRKTPGRLAILKVLTDRHGPFSIEELHQFVKGQKLDLVTVYRCLTSFEEVSLVKRCDFGDGIARYELNLGSHHHHHHVICKTCRKAENIEDCEVTRLEAIVEKMGYTKVTHNLEFFGICKTCKN